MSNLSELKAREKAFESKFAHDEALKFKVAARRNMKIGLWVAEAMGKVDYDAESYAKTVVLADLQEPGAEDVIRKLLADVSNVGLIIGEIDIRQKMAEFYIEAAEEVQQEV